MIDDMVTLLGKQQAEDGKQKEWCEDEFSKAADEKAASTAKKAQLEATLSELTDEITEITETVATLTEEIAQLDKSVADATEQRKEEHADYVEVLQLNEVALSLIAKAKNRLQKFYDPTLYKAAPVKELTMEE